MQCAEFRRLFGSNPKRVEPAVLEHRATCTRGCAEYARDMERVDQLLVSALDVAPPKAAVPPWELERLRAPSQARWYALAASVLIAIGIAAFVWSGQQREALIAEVVKHADRESNVLIPSEKRVTADKLRRTLAAGGAALITELPISIARTCKIRGNVAPHLVLQTRDGAVAVLLLTKERMLMPHSFVEKGYEGTLVPKGSHSIAVVGKSKTAVAEGAELVNGAIEWPK